MKEAWFCYGKVSNVSVVMSQNDSEPFRPISATPGRFSIFLSFQKKHFFGGILLASESPYLRVVNFTTILDMFFIYNGKFILDILNKNQITIKIVCTMRNVTKSIPPKKCFFWNDKKIENRPEGFWIVLGHHNRNIWHLSITKSCSIHWFWKTYCRPKGGGYFRTARY